MQISTDERFVACLTHLAAKFHRTVRRQQNRTVLNLPDTIDQDQLADAIVHQIVTRMKATYLHDQIKIKSDLLIRVLVNYDQHTDILIATSLIKITPLMLLDSIYDFALQRLKCRWHEVAQLVNDNHVQLTQKQVFDDLLRFLIVNMDCRMKEAHVRLINRLPTVCNSNLEPIKTNSDNIINTLIDMAPQRIYIHAEQGMQAQIIQEIEHLFPNCICIESGCVL